MTSPVASRKRKADALEADGSAIDGTRTRKPAPDVDSPAFLPATCLAAVLNFMWYTDVRQCLLAGKMMAVEAAGHVETLNITKASELVAPSACRFRNASKVNILCLVSEMEREDDEDDEEDGNHPPDQISMDTVARVVPFLSSIPKLERVYFGGLYLESEVVWGQYYYNADACEAPRGHHAIFNALVQNVIGGFQSRTLSQSLELNGILEFGQLECASREDDPDHPCQLCHHILSSFPLHLLLNPMASYGTFCIPHVDRIPAMIHRDGADAILRSNDGAEMLLGCLMNALSSILIKVEKSSKSEDDEAFTKKMKAQGASCHPSGIWLYGRAAFSKSFKDFLYLVKSTPLLQDVMKGIPKSRLLETFESGGPTGVGKQFSLVISLKLFLNLD